MMAVILAGGKGTRLKPFTVTIPKPLLPLGETPILEVVIAQLKAAGADRIRLTLGHMPHLFSASIGDGSRWGLSIDYHREESPLGTAGPLSLLDDLEDHFIVMNGDILSTIDYKALLEAHLENEAAATIALHQRTVDIDFGVIKAGEDGCLQEYIEKPSIPYEVSMGINVLSRRCLEYIPSGVKFDMPQLMQALVDAGEKVFCYRTDCYWQDIGRFDDYERANQDFIENPGRFIPEVKG